MIFYCVRRGKRLRHLFLKRSICIMSVNTLKLEERKKVILYVMAPDDCISHEKDSIVQQWVNYGESLAIDQHCVFLLNRKRNKAEAVALNSNSAELGAETLHDALIPLYRHIKLVRPDIVIAAETKTNFALLTLKPFLPKNIRYLIREDVPPSFYTGRSFPHGWMAKSAYRLLYKQADCVISPCQNIIDELAREGVILNDARVIYDAVTDCAQDSGTKLRPLSPEGHVHFVAAGEFEPHKGYDLLLQALSHTLMPREWHLTLIGEGAMKAELMHLIEGQGLKGRVSIKDDVSQSKPYFGAADAFLLPSLSEAMPYTALEALACGTPVIAMRSAGGIADVVAMSGKGVKTAATFEGFIDAMKAVKAQSKDKYAQSLLPKAFAQESARQAYNDVLKEILITSNRAQG